MRRFMVFLAVLCMFIGAAGAEEVWIDLGSHRSMSPTEVQISRSDITILEFDLTVPGLMLEAVQEDGRSFTRVSIPGAGQIGNVGSPLLPAFRRFVEVPEQAKVVVTTQVLDWGEVALADKGFSTNLYPVQLPLPKCDCPEARDWRFSFKEGAYAGVVEHELVGVESPVTMRDHRMVRLTFSPVEYDVEAGILRVATRVAVHLEFVGGDSPATMAKRQRLSSRSFDAFIGRSTLNLTFANPDDSRLGEWQYPDDAPVEFLIVTPPAFVTDLQPFVDWKTTCGFNVTVATTDTTGTTTTDIKNYITGLYNGANPPVYILMIGDSPGVLATYTPSGGGAGGTDLPFVQMDGDLYPDMMVARWPIDDSAELINMRDKILHYEQPTAANSGWLNRALYLAGYDYESHSMSTHEDVIAELMLPAPNSAEAVLWYDSNNPTTTDLINDLNTGRAWTVYSAHSGPSGWSGAPAFGSGDVPNMANIDKYPIGIGHSCSSNEWATHDDVFGEVTVTQADKGFVSYWGGSNSTQWVGDDWLERGYFDALFDIDMAGSQIPDLDGQYSNVAICYAGLTSVSLQGGDDENYYWPMYNLDGDPTLDPFTRQPTAINVGAPPAIAPSATDTFTVVVTDASSGAVTGALVGASQNGVLLGAGYTDASGTAVFHIDAPAAGTPVLVRVTAHNYLPTDESVMVGAEADGVVTLGASLYSCSATAVIDVFDANATGPFSVTLQTAAGNSILVTMTDVGDVTGHFQGSAVLGADLIVADGDTLSAIYNDQDTGSGSSEIKTVTAAIDCSVPVISGVVAAEIEWDSARVQFNTSEDAAATVRYGTSCGGLDQSVSGSFATAHSFPVNGLTPLTTYFFAIDAVDYVGNASTNDNGGACFSFTTFEEPVFFAEIFESSDNDLDGHSFTFTPNGSGSYYSGCAAEITVLPVDPTGGTVVSLSDDDSELVTLSGGATVGLYGAQHGSFYVVSNGYITFGESSTDYSETLGEHFGREQVALLYDDLNPSSQGTVSWKQLSDRMVVTWENVAEYNTSNSNTFQAELYFDGMVVLSYLQIDVLDGLAGLSEGQGLDPDFLETDLTGMGTCSLFLDGFESGDCSQWGYETP